MENAECEHLIFERDGSSRLLIQLGSELTRLSKPSFTVPAIITTEVCSLLQAWDVCKVFGNNLGEKRSEQIIFGFLSALLYPFREAGFQFPVLGQGIGPLQ